MSLNPTAALFVLITSIGLCALPRRYAPLPLLAGACYMSLGQGIDLGPLSFSIVRILIAVGLIRTTLRQESLPGGFNRLDVAIMLWASYLVVSGAFHPGALVQRLGLAYDALGLFFLFRIFCTCRDDLVHLLKLIGIVLIPVAAEMVVEKTMVRNLFSLLAGEPSYVAMREGALRARGPFQHPILAGTVGAVCLPMMIGIRKSFRWAAWAGGIACVLMVICSASSSPVMSAMVGLGVVFMWPLRRHFQRRLLWYGVCAYLLLAAVMQAPAYYIIARVSVVGGSTGWHRARLIETAIQHLNEWWLVGTDYTRHWMPTGVSWSGNHTDITNHYLKMGVLGGLPLMFLYIFMLGRAVSLLKECLRAAHLSEEEQFLIWSLTASLAVHIVTGVAVSYFDQSIMFLYVTLATAGAGYAALCTGKAVVPAPESEWSKSARPIQLRRDQPGFAGAMARRGERAFEK